MRRYTTPTHTLTVEGVDLTNASIWVTYEGADGNTFTVTDMDVTLEGDNTVLEVTLTEEQTASLATGNARVQVNWTNGGRRAATVIRTVKVTENLLEKDLL